MSHQLTRRNVSAIAKLDFAGLSHAQRLEAIAKALGYEAAAALMSTLKSTEASTQPAPAAPQPIRAVVAFGSGACTAVESNEKLRDKYGNVEGDISELTFNTPAELQAYSRGLADADEWLETMIVADDVDEPDHPFFKAVDENPELGFVDWHDAQTDEGEEMLSDEEIAEEEHRSLEEWIDIQIQRSENTTASYDQAMSRARPGRADEPIIGYQVESAMHGRTWKGRSSSEVLDKETAIADLRDSFHNNEASYFLKIIRKNDNI